MVVNLKTAIFCSAVAATAASATPPEPQRTRVSINQGTLEGVIDENVRIFRGIPYAAAPVGELRWVPPQPGPTWKGVRDAEHFGNICLNTTGTEGGSEDCLFLNVFAPLESDADESKLPVMVWVHGGGYEQGSSNLYDATKMVNYLVRSEQRAIVVSMNYRLHIFGFLGSAEMRKLDPELGSTGNYGLQDQRAAFQWVRDNIEAFGGDPQRVMIFGESAGAGSMSAHLVMPRSAGLFQSVGVESGFFSSWTAHPLDYAEKAYQEVLNATGCTDLACLRKTSASKLTEAVLSIPMGRCCASLNDNPWLTWSPAIDGVELIGHPYELARRGQVTMVPILHGTNLDEGSMFTLASTNATEEQLQKEFKDYYDRTMGDELTTTATTMYSNLEKHPEVPNVTHAWWVAQRAGGDQSFVCPANWASERLTQLGFKVYRYIFAHPEPKMAQHIPLVEHSSEIRYVFHQDPDRGWSAEERLLSEQMTSYWYRFAAFGTPNGGPSKDLVDWPQFHLETGERAHIHFDVASAGGIQASIEEVRAQQCEFMRLWLERVIPGRLQSAVQQDSIVLV
eukprot:CAMPEP_0206434000 /NCGR_PEP_ID=MMETSP0324_2-20121206/8862_1 /ASSEMBLY_ACC=CAM_ASM_000836 /TAXON_ID=2866 /ORGANISM="Crypthecodinium cohnii, Strain Seligo" /LENGTH=563 /DNA_ID=CAMNT_0053900361 /DNA_START=85 /DNA_END=1776 /DNA_ORIENTATION=+